MLNCRVLFLARPACLPGGLYVLLLFLIFVFNGLPGDQLFLFFGPPAQIRRLNIDARPKKIQMVATAIYYYKRVALYQYSKREHSWNRAVVYPICRSVCRSVQKVYCGKTAD